MRRPRLPPSSPRLILSTLDHATSAGHANTHPHHSLLTQRAKHARVFPIELWRLVSDLDDVERLAHDEADGAYMSAAEHSGVEVTRGAERRSRGSGGLVAVCTYTRAAFPAPTASIHHPQLPQHTPIPRRTSNDTRRKVHSGRNGGFCTLARLCARAYRQKPCRVEQKQDSGGADTSASEEQKTTERVREIRD